MRKRIAVLAAVFSVIALAAGVAAAGTDFGQFVQRQLADQSSKLYGVSGPLKASSTRSITEQQAQADPRDLATVARSLRVRVVSAGVAPPNLDQSAFWPNASNPKWLITCNEQGAADPGLVRINLATGASTTIVTGTDECDPVRATPWGTILFGEEADAGPDGGRMYELIDPLHTTGVTLDRATGTFSGGTGTGNLVSRSAALGRLSFEGLAIYANGLTYYSEDLGPTAGAAGVAHYKFIPATLRDPSAGPITNLDQSPYATPGKVFGLRIGTGNGFGQGAQYGQGTWVPLPGSPTPTCAPTGRRSTSPGTRGRRTSTSTAPPWPAPGCATAPPTPATSPSSCGARSSASATAPSSRPRPTPPPRRRSCS